MLYEPVLSIRMIKYTLFLQGKLNSRRFLIYLKARIVTSESKMLFDFFVICIILICMEESQGLTKHYGTRCMEIKGMKGRLPSMAIAVEQVWILHGTVK